MLLWAGAAYIPIDPPMPRRQGWYRPQASSALVRCAGPSAVWLKHTSASVCTRRCTRSSTRLRERYLCGLLRGVQHLAAAVTRCTVRGWRTIEVCMPSSKQPPFRKASSRPALKCGRCARCYAFVACTSCQASTEHDAFSSGRTVRNSAAPGGALALQVWGTA